MTIKILNIMLLFAISLNLLFTNIILSILVLMISLIIFVQYREFHFFRDCLLREKLQFLLVIITTIIIAIPTALTFSDGFNTGYQEYLLYKSANVMSLSFWISVIAFAVSEEFLFRAWIYGHLRKYSQKFATIISVAINFLFSIGSFPTNFLMILINLESYKRHNNILLTVILNICFRCTAIFLTKIALLF